MPFLSRLSWRGRIDKEEYRSLLIGMFLLLFALYLFFNLIATNMGPLKAFIATMNPLVVLIRFPLSLLFSPLLFLYMLPDLTAHPSGLLLQSLRMLAPSFIFYFTVIPAIIRRCHDLDRSSFWLVLPTAFVGLSLLAIGYCVGEVFTSHGPGFKFNSFVWDTLPAISGFVFFPSMAILLTRLIALFFADGTVGPNRFGEDPQE